MSISARSEPRPQTLRTVSATTAAKIGRLREAGLTYEAIRFELAGDGIALRLSTISMHAVRQTGLVRRCTRTAPAVRNGRLVLPYSPQEDALIRAGAIEKLDGRCGSSVRRRAEMLGEVDIAAPARGASFRRIATGIMVTDDATGCIREIVVTALGQRIWHALEDHLSVHGTAPSHAELAAYVGTSCPSVSYAVGPLLRAGVLGRRPRRWRGLSVLVPSGRKAGGAS